MQEPAGKIQSNLILYTYTILALCFFCTHGCPHTHSHTFFSSSSAIICEYKYVYFSSAFKHSEVLLLTRSLTCYYSECSSAFDWFSCCRPSGSCFFFPLSVWTPCLFCNQAWWTFNIKYKFWKCYVDFLDVRCVTFRKSMAVLRKAFKKIFKRKKSNIL